MNVPTFTCDYLWLWLLGFLNQLLSVLEDFFPVTLTQQPDDLIEDNCLREILTIAVRSFDGGISVIIVQEQRVLFLLG